MGWSEAPGTYVAEDLTILFSPGGRFYFRIYVAQASTEVTILLSQSMKIAAVCPHV